MTQEQTEMLIDSLKNGMMCGFDNWWDVIHIDSPPEHVEAWYNVFMEAYAGLVQEGQEDYTIEKFKEMVQEKWSNRYSEIKAVHALMEACREQGVCAAQVAECQKYGH